MLDHFSEKKFPELQTLVQICCPCIYTLPHIFRPQRHDIANIVERFARACEAVEAGAIQLYTLFQKRMRRSVVADVTTV